MSQAGIRSLFEKFGILATPQRLEVAAILLEKPQHLSADQIIERLRSSGSAVFAAAAIAGAGANSQVGRSAVRMAWSA